MARRPPRAYVPTKLTVFYGAAEPRVAKFSHQDDALTFARAVSTVAGVVAEVAHATGIIARYEAGERLPDVIEPAPDHSA